MSLAYNSAAGNGIFGIGWSLDIGVITRKTEKRSPNYDGSDIYLHGSEELVPATNAASRTEEGYIIRAYHTRLVQAPMRIESWTSVADESDVHWRTISGDNVTKVYGRDDKSRLVDQTTTPQRRIFSWPLCESYDSHGNLMVLTYKEENSQGIDAAPEPIRAVEECRTDAVRKRMKHLKSIKYGNVTVNRALEDWKVIKYSGDWMFEVVFDYGEHSKEFPTTKEDEPWELRKDSFSSYASGFELRCHRLCRRVLMFHHFPTKLDRDDCLTRSVSLTYNERESFSFLASFSQNGHLPGDGSEDIQTQSLPPYQFQYSSMTASSSIVAQRLDTTALIGLPGNADESIRWLDLNGEGLSGLLQEHKGGAMTYQRNEKCINRNSPQIFGPRNILRTLPSFDNTKSHYFEDLDGDGIMQLVCLDSNEKIGGYHSRYRSGWKNFVPFMFIPTIDINDPTLMRIDLTGNGLLDLLYFDAYTQQLIWHECLGKLGFGSERRVSVSPGGPQLVTGDSNCIVHLADMSGDGRTDIVHISATRISYWPNLGRGFFGDEVVMHNPPRLDVPFGIDSNRIMLADVDGSGTTDLLYFPVQGGIRMYFNLAGNGWSEANTITSFPAINPSTQVFASDLFGNGTSCICWTGPQANSLTKQNMFYLDLAAGLKPNLLTRYSNGFGASVDVSYRSSNWFYLVDEREGKPWTTKIGFPVNCVSQIDMTDSVTGNATSSRYAYHDGYFDGVEHEFRGFGMVERWDAVEFKSGTAETFQKPPIHTKTWFHNGYRDYALDHTYSQSANKPSEMFVYSKNEVIDLRDTMRALSGQILRQETYSDDTSSLAPIPFVITENSYLLSQVQTAGDGHPAAIRVSPRETIIQQMEREDTEKARTSRRIILETNEFGDPVRVADIAFGLAGGTMVQQLETFVTLTYTQYTNAVVDEPHNFRRPLICEETNYALKGISTDGFLQTHQPFVPWLERTIRKAITVPTSNDATELKTPYKIITSKSRHYQRAGDLTHRLKLGVLESFSVPDQSYNLVWTKELLQSTYAEHVGRPAISNDVLRDGGYFGLGDTSPDEQQNPADGCWWSPSDRLLFHEDPAKELASARSSFFTPLIRQDPFKNRSRTIYDKYWLTVCKKTDAVGNEITYDHDYVSLKPAQVTDANDNRQIFQYDAFDDTACIGHLGKQDKSFANLKHKLKPLLPEPDVQDFLQKPDIAKAKAMLGNLTTRTITDVNAWARTSMGRFPRPAVQATITRDRYANDYSAEDLQIQVRFDYLDGHGNLIQSCDFINQSEQEMWRFTPQVTIDNVGNRVQEFQPYFAKTHEFKGPTEIKGSATTLLHDSLNRLVAVLSPDHAFTKTVIGSWSTTSFERGNTVSIADASKDPDVGNLFARIPRNLHYPSWHSQHISTSSSPLEREAAAKSLIYANKPRVEHFDALHRPIATITDDGIRKLETRESYDSRGNLSTIIDQKGRVAESRVHDLLGRTVQVTYLDSGATWSLLACDDQIQYQWNARGTQTRMSYDALRRPVTERVLEARGSDSLVRSIAYGESAKNAKSKNLRGQVFEVRDQAGVQTNVSYDRDYNCTQEQRQFCANYKTVIDWTVQQDLETDKYDTRYKFDAQGRLLSLRNGKGASTVSQYNRAGHLYAVSWRPNDTAELQTNVKSTLVEADGLVRQIEYGNKVTTSLVYDSATRKTLQKKTVRKSDSTKVLQDLAFTYDIQHRLIHVTDYSQSDIFFRNVIVRPRQEYSYNAIGSLMKATGRELLDAATGVTRTCPPYQSGTSRSTQPFPTNGEQLCRYIETYKYDEVGNIMELSHQPMDDEKATGWTREYYYNTQDNKLVQTKVGEAKETYLYESEVASQGCITKMAGFSLLSWDWKDQLRASSTQKVKAGCPETTWYVYDGAGRRVRKVTEYASSDVTLPSRKRREISFLPDAEIDVLYSGNGKEVKKLKISHSISASDPIAIVEQTLTERAADALLVRYQIGSSMEVDDKGQLVSYEEYSPFGTTTYVACAKDIEAPSRYRYAAYERDQETGFHYCQNRYYISWLGRWLSPDPNGSIDGLNLLRYCRNDPINLFDPSGTCPEQTGMQGLSP